jgi:CheY-like chemotaxis protein
MRWLMRVSNFNLDRRKQQGTVNTDVIFQTSISCIICRFYQLSKLMFLKTPLRVLIVDPSNDINHTLTMLFELVGCEVESALNGMHALACAKAFQPHIIFTEILLEDVDGLTLPRRLGLIPGIKKALIVALTTFYQKNIEWRALSSGFDKFLLKPASVEELVSILRHAAMLHKCDALDSVSQ